MIIFNCVHCKHEVSVEDSDALHSIGNPSLVECPSCHGHIHVPLVPNTFPLKDEPNSSLGYKVVKVCANILAAWMALALFFAGFIACPIFCYIWYWTYNHLSEQNDWELYHWKQDCSRRNQWTQYANQHNISVYDVPREIMDEIDMQLHREQEIAKEVRGKNYYR